MSRDQKGQRGENVSGRGIAATKVRRRKAASLKQKHSLASSHVRFRQVALYVGKLEYNRKYVAGMHVSALEKHNISSNTQRDTVTSPVHTGFLSICQNLRNNRTNGDYVIDFSMSH